MELAEKYGVEYWANHLDGVPMKQCLKRNYIVFEQDCITYKEWKEAHK
jgi:predicted kinase